MEGALQGFGGARGGLLLTTLLSVSVAVLPGAAASLVPVSVTQGTVATGTGCSVTGFCLGNSPQLLWQPDAAVGQPSTLDGQPRATLGQENALT